MATLPRNIHVTLLLVSSAALAASSAAAQNLDLRDLEFTGLPPCRIFDTRLAGAQTSGSPLPNPGPHCFQIRDMAGCGVPLTAKAVTLNATVVSPTAGGDLRLYPASATPGLFDPSTMNYNAGTPALANGAILPLAPGGGCSGNQDMKVLIGMGGSGSVHLIIDVTGYFGPPGSGPLWGHGRPGTMVWGEQIGPFNIPCVNGDYQFGLSQKAVTWEDAAEACPQGWWVCTSAQRGTAACNTARPFSTCDELNCDRSCNDLPDNNLVGWLADTNSFYGGLSSKELGGTATDLVQCVEVPVWCCAGT